MKTKLMALMILVAGSAFAQSSFSVGVNIGGPGYYAPAAPYYVARPPMPAPGYMWIDGYYDAYRRPVPGYWATPPYAGAYWVAPRYNGGRFYNGYWNGPRRGYAPGWGPRYDRGRYDDRGRGWGNGYRR
ncbi:MAG: hypothetical protein ABL995_00500 [Bryobacteraceae bacterium]